MTHKTQEMLYLENGEVHLWQILSPRPPENNAERQNFNHKKPLTHLKTLPLLTMLGNRFYSSYKPARTEPWEALKNQRGKPFFPASNLVVSLTHTQNIYLIAFTSVRRGLANRQDQKTTINHNINSQIDCIDSQTYRSIDDNINNNINDNIGNNSNIAHNDANMGGNIGIDCENTQRKISPQQIVNLTKRFFSVQDQEVLRQCREKDSLENWKKLFFRFWTTKEAYAKASNIPLFVAMHVSHHKILKKTQSHTLEGLRDIENIQNIDEMEQNNSNKQNNSNIGIDININTLADPRLNAHTNTHTHTSSIDIEQALITTVVVCPGQEKKETLLLPPLKFRYFSFTPRDLS